MDLVAQIQASMASGLPGHLGTTLISAGADEVTGSLVVEEHLCTIGGILHGGAIMAFADTLGAVATVLNLPAGAGTTTIESKTNFVSAARTGATITGTTTPIHKGRQTMVWQTRVECEGKLVALVTQTQMVLAPRT